ncbi:DUF2284 domain-containing protein [Alkalibacter saccharofermentans]|uniref:Predicted metal-binding protein n=1 Tax=Alkalibacter saccharofermentans DSM 14828 TaxID=1120975 RepID=A0A1M4ZBG6_9FIRM|nr:DUF2284 domain-containing protein [Alkalibacter saccharofermentans]SHF15361.1 Predicted metal-binding protein [Alkalibacter saccharofermentans DSM 14828]
MTNILDVIPRHVAHHHKIPISSIKLSEEVRNMCEQNRCGHYGKNWVCPPAIDDLDKIKKDFSSYDKFIVLYEVYELKNQYDWKGMVDSAIDFQHKLLDVKNQISKETRFKILGVGACALCKKCTYIDGEPCRRPDDKIISLEAHGIDVISLMKDNGLKYNNGPNTVTYIGGIMY